MRMMRSVPPFTKSRGRPETAKPPGGRPRAYPHIAGPHRGIGDIYRERERKREKDRERHGERERERMRSTYTMFEGIYVLLGGALSAWQPSVPSWPSDSRPYIPYGQTQPLSAKHPSPYRVASRPHPLEGFPLSSRRLVARPVGRIVASRVRGDSAARIRECWLFNTTNRKNNLTTILASDPKLYILMPNVYLIE